MPTFSMATREAYAYSGEHLRELAFPLGGIGTGCVSLEGRGSLRDWEIFGRPNKGSILPMTFPILWCQAQGQEPQTRVVQGPPTGGFIGHSQGSFYASYGFGMTRSQGDGLPHFSAARFRGTFPMATVDFEHDLCPLRVQLRAFNPFIPLDHVRSSMPLASLTYRLHNPGRVEVKATLAMSLHNAVGYAGVGQFVNAAEDRCLNQLRQGPNVRGLFFTNERYPADHPRYGSMALSTDWPDVTSLPYWFRSTWFDSLHYFWDMFSPQGELSAKGTTYEAGEPTPGSLGLRVTLKPGESAELPLLISWCFPNASKYWGEPSKEPEEKRPRWTHAYAKRWPDAWVAAEDFFTHRETLTRRTESFERALYDSTLPTEALESAGATASILHSPTCLQLEDGTFWAWEGCGCESGCCEGSCSHVWNYAQTQAFLFPALHRSMRSAEYEYGFDSGEPGEKGAVVFRIPLPLGTPAKLWHAASDGQLGGVVQLYRDWRLSGDEAYLSRMWPHAKKALEYAWVQWDTDRDGLVDGDQHNTFDINFQGPNPLTQGFYLAALEASRRIAEHLGDNESAKEYARLYQSGREKMQTRLFNGEYFQQTLDCLAPDAPKYQHGKGCLSDQLLGQLSAHMAGLGHILDPALVRKTLRSIYAYNFHSPLGDHANMQRIYALADESALLVCSWPHGGRPAFPFPYSDETWTGFEYQVASHMLFEGMAEEALTILRALRHRYDGRRRNPYNEIECGSHYARALAAWGVLVAMSGFRYDAVEKTIYLTPRCGVDYPIRCFFSTGSAWGSFTYCPSRVATDDKAAPVACLPSELTIHVHEGEMVVAKVILPTGEKTIPQNRQRLEAGRTWIMDA